MAVRIVEWYVKANRNGTTVRLPAPEGEDEANAMAAHLVGFDWHDVKVENDPQFIEVESEGTPGSGVWPTCERCERKHSPFSHEAEGCAHCMAICRKPVAKPRNRSKAKVEPPKPEYQQGMTFEEFKNWLEGAL